MRKYFWAKDDIELITYTVKYENVLKIKPAKEDICCLILNSDKKDDFALAHVNYGMEDNRLEFAIEEKGEYMGCVNLCGIDRKNHRTSASIYLTPESRGKGIGGRALQFAYSFAAKELDCTSFFTCVSLGNMASARMMYKLGMEMTGVQREAAFVGGQYVDTLFFEGRYK